MANLTNDDIVAYVLVTTEKDQEVSVAMQASDISITEGGFIVASVSWSGEIQSASQQLILGLRATSQPLFDQLMTSINDIEGVESTTVLRIASYYEDRNKKDTPIDKP